MLADLDRREGYDPDDPAGSAYLRRRTTVTTADGPAEAWVYVTNPQHARVVPLDLAMRARILLHATPRHAPRDRPRGAQYLLPLVRWLRDRALPAPDLEALVEAMEAQVGPLAAHPTAWVGAGGGG